jgi:hypothetical protein
MVFIIDHIFGHSYRVWLRNKLVRGTPVSGSCVCVNIYIYIYIYTHTYISVILYECETLSLTLREEHRLRMFENRVLK